ncbi:MAG: energy-coupling factor transport system substrate-specific component [Frankiaceae bacterium]|jgi:energy-coupling factor transport system substrate-specific component|nr:energy-coupling factor transport system substrate-specific component [Frankiaceae bacterium]
MTGVAGSVGPAPSLAVLRLRLRSGAALLAASLVGLAAFCWPLLDPSFLGSHSADAPWVFVALLPLCLAVVFAELSDGGFDAKTVAVLGILAGVDAALRPLSGGGTGFTFVYLLIICGGRVFGRGFGFSLGALSLFASALLTAGVGPWLPFQMVGAGWVGLGAGCLPRARGRAELGLLAVYGAAAALLYGALLNLSFWPFAHYYPAQIAFLPHGSVATNLLHWWRFDITTSLGFDIPAAVGNVVLLLVLGRPVLIALRRVTRRAAFDAPVEMTAG